MKFETQSKLDRGWDLLQYMLSTAKKVDNSQQDMAEELIFDEKDEHCTH